MVWPQDNTLGVALGLPTLAAAAMGQVLSDAWWRFQASKELPYAMLYRLYMGAYAILGWLRAQDTCGVAFGGTIEAAALKLGLPLPGLTDAQQRLGSVKRISTLGGVSWRFGGFKP